MINFEQKNVVFKEIMMHFPFFGNSSKVNVLDQLFNPDHPAHVALVKDKLRDFIAAKDALFAVDGKITLALSADMALFMIGFIGTLPAALFLLAIGYVAAKQGDRIHLGTDFTAKLNDVMDVYHWIIKGKTTEITHAPIFMEVAEVIAPFVTTEEIMPWKITKSDNLSEPYIQLMLKSPHRVQLQRSETPSYFSSLFANAEPVVNNEEASSLVPYVNQVTKKGKETLGYFEQTFAESRRAIYGYKH
jgi:hypothetical protein